jgi:gamma-glutamyl:cysteine ligase YbdK (ATP-grasp superfamily)
MFRAARFGVRGELPDVQGRRRPVSELLKDALQRADPWAHELGCVEQLAKLPELLERGGGAGMQRATYEIAGIDAVLRELLQRTGDT